MREIEGIQTVVLELTRFRGHFSMLCWKEVHDAPQSFRIPA